jgi:hypothetical protein
VYVLAQTGAVGGIFLRIIFAVYFWKGVEGTFAWHSERKAVA